MSVSMRARRTYRKARPGGPSRYFSVSGDEEVDVERLHIDRPRAAILVPIEKDECPVVVRDLGDRRHVGAGAVQKGELRQRDDARALIDRTRVRTRPARRCLTPSRNLTRAPRGRWASQICPIVGNSYSPMTIASRESKASALAIGLIPPDALLTIATSSGSALMNSRERLRAAARTRPSTRPTARSTSASSRGSPRSPLPPRTTARPASSYRDTSSRRSIGKLDRMAAT